MLQSVAITPGTGKTHLLLALGSAVRDTHTDVLVAYLPVGFTEEAQPY